MFDAKQLLSSSGSTRNLHVSRAQGLSLALHGLVISLLFIQWNAINGAGTKPIGGPDVGITSVDLQEVMRRLKGGGSGGNRNPVPPTRGNLPPMQRFQVVPVTPRVNPNARLQAEMSIVGPPDIRLPRVDLQRTGIPNMPNPTDSFGPGGPSGMGNKKGHGAGIDGDGDGFGPGSGTGVTVPSDRDAETKIVCDYCPNPKYTDEARRTKFHGIVLLRVVVSADGHPLAIRVTKSAGLGLDESAIAAVKEWKFRPARDRSGRPVTAWTIVEVNFHIY